MSAKIAKKPEKRRKAPADERRLQLIKATLKCIAKRGIIGTTLAQVAQEAGLSQGIVNLHFKSKDNLLTETLSYLADDYRNAVTRHIDRAEDTPVAKLTALIDVDFTPSIFNRRKIAVWFAFQGEAQSRPTYRNICRTRDTELDNVMLDLVSRVIEQGGYDHIKPTVVVDAVSALANGLWLSYLINPEDWHALRAREAAFSYLSSIFPNDFA